MTSGVDKKVITTLPPISTDTPPTKNSWRKKEVLEAAEVLRVAQQKEEEWIRRNLRD